MGRNTILISKSIGEAHLILCETCNKEWIDTDFVWVGAPRGNRCTKCLPFEEEARIAEIEGDSS